MRPHYEALATHAGELALLAYHFPAVSPPGIPVEVLADLPIAGVKDSSGDAGRLVAELGAYDGPLYVGSSAYLALAGPLGATGAILSLANTDPEGCIAALAGDMQAQRALLPGRRTQRPVSISPRAPGLSFTAGPPLLRRAAPAARRMGQRPGTSGTPGRQGAVWPSRSPWAARCASRRPRPAGRPARRWRTA